MTEGWTPIALSRDVPAGATRAVLLDGQELVIWRGDGAAHVWEDRCPHRGMRLSLGFVRDNALNCLYHGWQYSPSASCVRIPAHPDLNVPPTIKASAFEATEAAGLVWVRLAGTDPLPDLPANAAPVVSLAVETQSLDGPHLVLPLEEAELHLFWHRVAPGRIMAHALLAGSADIVRAASFARSWRNEIERQAA